MDHHAELGEFLRSRRARLSPQEAGLPAGQGPRRVPGLRREELARLAGVSTDYYARLEQGRQLGVSEAVLDAVARALQLNPTERAYVLELAKRKPRGRRRPVVRPERVRPGLHRMLETLDGLVPAFIMGRRMDVLAANRLARALIVDFDALPQRERNAARHMFLDESARELYVDWEGCAAETAGALRMLAARYPDDPQLTDLVGELSIKSPQFRTWWADHNVRERTHGTKRFHHPVVGRLDLAYETAAFPGDAGQTLCVYTVEPGSPSESALRLLASWTGEDAPARPHANAISGEPSQ